MAASGMRVLVLAALAVGLLAAAVSGARDAMKVARGLVPTDGGGGGVAGGAAAGQQRKGARILAAETFAHHAPLPDYLDHIPRRQALATSTRCHSLLSLSSLSWILRLLFLSSHSAFLLPLPLISLFSLPLIPSHFSALLASYFSAPLASHFSYLLVSFIFARFPLISARLGSRFFAPLCSHFSAFHGSHFSAPLCSHFAAHFGSQFSAPLTSHSACGRTTVTIRSQYLGPYDLHNDIYNMTFYNGCAYNLAEGGGGGGESSGEGICMQCKHSLLLSIVRATPRLKKATATIAADLASQAADLASQAADLASQAADLASQAADLASQAADLASQAPLLPQTRPSSFPLLW
ncbi:unnamed protein product [Closterium sp. Naga37s-1]|nr:unnamed protein product [Closterium sp. Naga37s-1]